MSWENKSPFDSILSQQRLRQKLPKSVNVRQSYRVQRRCRFFARQCSRVRVCVCAGYFSWRNSADGSWFIRALVRVFARHAATMSLQHMMTMVGGIVARDFESCTDDDFTSGMKQVPCTVSTLTRLLYLQPAYLQ